MPRMSDLDVRLRDGIATTRAELACIASEHDAPAGKPCPMCGWRTDRTHPACPSAVVARALRHRRALPGWLAHLPVPGAIRSKETAMQTVAELDALPGLFPAPVRENRRAA
jgi:hypothetical protein